MEMLAYLRLNTTWIVKKSADAETQLRTRIVNVVCTLTTEQKESGNHSEGQDMQSHESGKVIHKEPVLADAFITLVTTSYTTLHFPLHPFIHNLHEESQKQRRNSSQPNRSLSSPDNLHIRQLPSSIPSQMSQSVDAVECEWQSSNSLSRNFQRERPLCESSCQCC